MINQIDKGISWLPILRHGTQETSLVLHVKWWSCLTTRHGSIEIIQKSENWKFFFRFTSHWVSVKKSLRFHQFWHFHKFWQFWFIFWISSNPLKLNTLNIFHFDIKTICKVIVNSFYISVFHFCFYSAYNSESVNLVFKIL